MNKLIIFSKSALIRPASGDYIKSYGDQKVIPGVVEVLNQDAAEGWQMVIASNQPGCCREKCAAKDFPLGAYWFREPSGLIDDEIPARVVRKQYFKDENIVTLHTESAIPPKSGWFNENTIIEYRIKSLQQCCDEFSRCLELLPQISKAYWATTWKGEERLGCIGRSGGLWMSYAPGALLWAEGNFLKPSPDMLLQILHRFETTQAIMVGTRFYDEQAAHAANIQFMWADEFFRIDYEDISKHKQQNP